MAEKMMIEIVKAPNPILSKKANPVKKIDKSILRLVSDMEEALYAAKDPIGVGLAAPQVGKSLQLFITRPSLKSKTYVFINPKITKKITSKKNKPQAKIKKLEGCLSLVNIWGDVGRYPEVFVSFQDEIGKLHKKKFTGFLSTIVQHEIDHLNGILFPKRVLEQKGTLYKSEKDENGEDVFDELKI